ncbi:MAG: NADH-quinone oxidoreductase subunit C [Deltaproteobacteria bacterium]|nr:NADH-quinone oxidoreductase subunit C [Deltaproteobacteria bacterium]
MPTPEEFRALLEDDFGVSEWSEKQPPLIEAVDHHRLAEVLKERGYTLYVFVVASHRPGVEGAEDALTAAGYIELATGLRSPTENSQLAIWRVRVGLDEQLATLVDLFAGADWQEREQFDLVGVRFAGHPDPRRLMLPEDWEGHPLRRDYAINTPHPPWR